MPKAMLLQPKPIFDAESHVVEAKAKMRQKEIVAAPEYTWPNGPGMALAWAWPGTRPGMALHGMTNIPCHA